jgi:tRNA A37 threonylcarbamoyladenosine modification protein TsaB
MQQSNDIKVEALVISLASPLLIGIYKDSVLIKTYSADGKTSDILPELFQKILEEYKLQNIYYVNGPGSYMAIKVAYLFLQTLSIVKNISLYATDGFTFNGNSPIKALGKKYFFKQHDGTIKIDFLENNNLLGSFQLPEVLNRDDFTSDPLPNYNLPAI